MQYQTRKGKIPTRPNKLSDPGEMNRLLMTYGGIFKHSIKEYAEKVIAKTKVHKNYSK